VEISKQEENPDQIQKEWRRI